MSLAGWVTARWTAGFTLVVLLVGLMLLTPQIVRASTVAYKITDGFTYSGIPFHGNGYVFFFTTPNIPYVRGKMLLSSTPDGTGSARIGDFIDIYQNYPHNGRFTYRAKPDCVNGSSILPPTDLSNMFYPATVNVPNNQPTIRLLEWCGGAKTISPLYLVNIDDSDKPTPFLDLPWDYKGKGLSFGTAATAINSYFDHEYPLLSRIGQLLEPASVADSVVTYEGLGRQIRPYSSHDGYDWGKKAGAQINFKNPVFAAASGYATRYGVCAEGDSNCKYPCGNEIEIDHQNGFQTRYCHMRPYNLIASSSADRVWVERGQKIGEVGFTGHVIPSDETGAHIHFMVVYDKNRDGNFEDNIPDGLIDPFGWQSKEPDPWENYAFSYAGGSRTGMKSMYLWTTSLASKDVAIPTNGGSTDVDIYNVSTTSDTNNHKEFELKAFIGSFIAPNSLLRVIGPGLSLLAYDVFGNPITSFASPITISADFSKLDLSHYNSDTLSFYSSSNGNEWAKENSVTVDWQNKKVTLYVSHLTDFVLMAERLDTTAPTTNAIFNGVEGKANVYLPNVSVSLQASDGAGLGVEYTAYNIDGSDWQEYSEPIVVSDEGVHEIEYYSADNDENIEEPKTTTFIVQSDTTPPVTSIAFDGDLISGITYKSDVAMRLSATDGAGFGVSQIKYDLDDRGWQVYSSPVTVSDIGEHSISYYSTDLANNIEATQAADFEIRKNFDTTPPEITIRYDPNHKTFMYGAIDSSGSASLEVSSLSSSRKHLTALDQAQNALVVEIEEDQDRLTKTLSVMSLGYSRSSVLPVSKNALTVSDTNLLGFIPVFTQLFVSKDFGSVLLNYDKKRDETTIVRTGNGKIVTFRQNGKIMLQLKTNVGRLEYSY